VPRPSARLGGVALLLVIGGALGAYFATSGGGKRRPVAWQNVTAEVPPAVWARPTISVIRNQAKLEKLFVVATYGRHPRAPRIDFGHREALLITTGPRSSSGYALRVERVTERGGSIVVLVRERTPLLGEHVVPRLTYPLLLITLPRSSKHIDVKYAGRS